MPPEHSLEQHWVPSVQPPLPVVMQLGLSVPHVPASSQMPLAHCTFVVQPPASCDRTVVGKPHTMALHAPLQQSDAWKHAPPSLRQLPPASGLKGLPSRGGP